MPSISDHAYPWTPDLGVNEWIPVSWQWALCAGLWFSVFAWVVVGTYLNRHGGANANVMNWIHMLDKGLPFALMTLLGYPIFFGFVSHALPIRTWLDFITDILLLVPFTRLKVLVPYLVGGFSGLVFFFPVLTALEAKLVAYDYGWYSINVIWTTGASNALTAVAEQRGWISPWTRWVGQSLGWPSLMSGIPVVMMLLGSDFSDAYKLNFAQLLRYSTFQVSLYLFIYAGICRSVEEHLKSSGALGTDHSKNNLDDTPCYAILPITVGILVQFGAPFYGFPITIVGTLLVLCTTKQLRLPMPALAGRSSELSVVSSSVLTELSGR